MHRGGLLSCLLLLSASTRWLCRAPVNFPVAWGVSWGSKQRGRPMQLAGGASAPMWPRPFCFAPRWELRFAHTPRTDVAVQLRVLLAAESRRGASGSPLSDRPLCFLCLTAGHCLAVPHAMSIDHEPSECPWGSQGMSCACPLAMSRAGQPLQASYCPCVLLLLLRPRAYSFPAAACAVAQHGGVAAVSLLLLLMQAKPGSCMKLPAALAR